MSSVICHISCVMCHLSHVRCHLSHVRCHLLQICVGGGDKVVELVNEESVVNEAYPVKSINRFSKHCCKSLDEYPDNNGGPLISAHLNIREKKY